MKLNTTGISNLKINRAAATSDLLPIYLAAPVGKCISKTVTTSTTETFRYVLGTNSCANKRLIFTVS